MEKVLVSKGISSNIRLGRICIYLLSFLGGMKCELECRSINRGPLEKILNCSDTDIYTIPKPQYPYNQYFYLELERCRNLRLHKDDFYFRWDVLQFLYLSEIPIDKQRHNISMDIFSNFKHPLSFEFHFTSSGLDDSMTWILPASTRRCSWFNNSYTRIDVSSAEKLWYFEANNNKLINLPKVQNESRIEFLHLAHNPLDNLTVKDLARYCNLQEFFFIPTPDSKLITEEKKCDCEELQKFVATFNINKTELKCAGWGLFSLWKRFKGCDLTLANVKNIRATCGDGHLLPLPKTSWLWSILRFLLALICAMLLLFFFSFITYNRFTRTPPETPPPDILEEEFTVEGESSE